MRLWKLWSPVFLTGNQVAHGTCFKRVRVWTNTSSIFFSLSLCSIFFWQPQSIPEEDEEGWGFGVVCVCKRLLIYAGGSFFSSFLQRSCVIFKVLYSVWKLGISKMLFCLLHQSIPLSLQAVSDRGHLSFQKYICLQYPCLNDLEILCYPTLWQRLMWSSCTYRDMHCQVLFSSSSVPSSLFEKSRISSTELCLWATMRASSLSPHRWLPVAVSVIWPSI